MIMRILDPYLAESIISERRSRGIDGPDEVWDGVYVVLPTRTIEHQRILGHLGLILATAVENSSRGTVLLGANVSDRAGADWIENLRVPDVVVVLDGGRAVDCNTHYYGGPDFLIEVESPGDETDAKIPFYARVGVRELLVVHRDTRELRLFRHGGTDLAPVEPSDLQSRKWLVSAVVPLAFRRTTTRGQGPRTEVRRTDGTPGQWVV